MTEVDWESENNVEQIKSKFSAAEITEELLRKRFEAEAEIKVLQHLSDQYRREIIGILGESRDPVMKGDYTMIPKEVKGRVTIDWKRLAIDLCGKESVEAELGEHPDKYVKESEPGVRIEIVRKAAK